MPVKIHGLEYYTVSDLLERLDVSRQTFWRWRQEGKIPAGQRFRNRDVVLTPQQMRDIESFANLLDPIDEPVGDQLSLFEPEK
jgi:hypothetical protein